MNEYGFDYMNYLSGIPNSMSYPSAKDMNNSYSMAKDINVDYSTSKEMNTNYVPNNQAKLKKMTNFPTIEPYQGFVRGNLFEDLYEPYKNYKPMELNPSNEKEALLYQYLQYHFALTDLDLYLDTHPNDREAIALYNKYLMIGEQMRMKYENMYGPLMLDSKSLNKATWIWKDGPWPWEGV